MITINKLNHFNKIKKHSQCLQFYLYINKMTNGTIWIIIGSILGFIFLLLCIRAYYNNANNQALNALKYNKQAASLLGHPRRR